MTKENIQSVKRAIEILNSFSLEEPELSITELSRRLAVSKSTVHRLLTTMLKEGLIEQNRDNQHYRLGIGILRMSEVILRNLNIRTIALPYLKQLRDTSEETASLNIVSRFSRICIEKMDSFHYLRQFIDIGFPQPLYAGASGKTLLAFQDDSFLEVVLETAKNTSIDLDKLQKDLARIRKNGYCVTTGERVVGATSLSAPIFSLNNKVGACITISGPTNRFTPDKVNDFTSLITEAAQSISSRLRPGG